MDFLTATKDMNEPYRYTIGALQRLSNILKCFLTKTGHDSNIKQISIQIEHWSISIEK